MAIKKEYEGLTQAMFYEFRHQTTSDLPAIFTLKNKDWEGCASVYLLYMQYDTEYDAAIGILGSWPHWQKLCNSPWFAKAKETWDEERKLRDESIAKRALLDKARDGDVAAAKAILAGKPATSRGRPKNSDKQPTDNSRELDQMLYALDGGRK